jgi:hypothetical protein
MPIEANNKTVAVLNLGHVVPHAFDKKTFATIKAMSKSITRKVYEWAY